jgi:hypothetical protein
MGKGVIIVTGGLTVMLGIYAIVSGIVKAASSTDKSDTVRVMPFTSTTSGIYNKDVDQRLKFVTAMVCLDLKSLCDAGKDITWDSLQAVLAQCPVLEADQVKIDTQETFGGKLSEVEVSTWFYDFVKKHDADVFDAARIHGPEINEIIQFVSNHSASHYFFAGAQMNSSGLLDIGMIRFPTVREPCVKLYRLQLRGTYSGSRFMLVFTGDEERVLTTSVSSRKYYPRGDLLRIVDPARIENTISFFEDMLAE